MDEWSSPLWHHSEICFIWQSAAWKLTRSKENAIMLQFQHRCSIVLFSLSIVSAYSSNLDKRWVYKYISGIAHRVTSCLAERVYSLSADISTVSLRGTNFAKGYDTHLHSSRTRCWVMAHSPLCKTICHCFQGSAISIYDNLGGGCLREWQNLSQCVTFTLSPVSGRTVLSLQYLYRIWQFLKLCL